MGVIEMQASRLHVITGRFMHVGRAGHEGERQIECTTAQREDPTHPLESNRVHEAVLSHRLMDRTRPALRSGDGYDSVITKPRLIPGS